MGARPGVGAELEYFTQERIYEDISTGLYQIPELTRDLALMNIMVRGKWRLGGKRSLDASLGAVLAQDAFSEGEQGGFLTPGPLASMRLTQPFANSHKAFGEIAARHSVVIEPTGYNQLGVKETPSYEVKIGGDGLVNEKLRYALSAYSRLYREPSLPEPEVFWNYAETQKTDFAYVSGGNFSAQWFPNHHVGLGVNGSVVQGDYVLESGDYLPWEMNRTLDLVSNLRFLPRRDSLLSIIVTYNVNNGVPLYEYQGLFAEGSSTGERRVAVSTFRPEVSRQRLDLRINLDLKSKWRPLESMRFFFEADNIFADFDGNGLGWVGGDNERRRGWTRANTNGDLEPVIARGMGLFILFGVEGKLKI
jgi:hypothetical protein